MEDVLYLADYTFARKPSGALFMNAQVELVRGPSDEILGGTHFGSYIKYQNPPVGNSVTWTESFLCGVTFGSSGYSHHIIGDVKLWGPLPIPDEERTLLSAVTMQ